MSSRLWRARSLEKHFDELSSHRKNLAEIFNLAVVITNQVTADPGAAAAFVQDAKKAVGGHIVAHITDTRVALRKGKGDQRIARIEQHPMMPTGEAAFMITAGGVNVATD